MKKSNMSHGSTEHGVGGIVVKVEPKNKIMSNHDGDDYGSKVKTPKSNTGTEMVDGGWQSPSSGGKVWSDNPAPFKKTGPKSKD